MPNMVTTDSPKKPLDGVGILLVEDYPMNILFARGMLERLGARVDVAINGQDAIDKLDTYCHQVVLMDIQMPVMDGYESTRYLRLRGETLPIIALTADTTPETLHKVRAAGLNDVLVKPFKADTLLAILNRYC